MQPFVPIKSDGQPGGSLILDRIQGLLKAMSESLFKVVTNDRISDEITLTAGTPVKVYHGLSRVPETVEVVSLNAGVVVFENKTNPFRSQYVLLDCSSSTCKVRVRFT